VARTETMVVLSTHIERARIALEPAETSVERPRRSAARARRHPSGSDET
jgi:hypothetical protein